MFSSRPALRESLSKGLSVRRWEKQPGVSRRKETTGDKGKTINSVPLEFPRLCLTVEANVVILSDVLPEIC